jgi:hypothetical protein
MRLGPGERRDPLHEIKDAFRLVIFLAQNRFDDLRRLGFGKAALAQERFAVVVRAGDDPFPCGLDPSDERRRRGIGKARQPGRCLMRETLRREFGMPDRDLLEILDAPQIAIHADRAEIEARNAKRLAAHFAIPAIEPPGNTNQVIRPATGPLRSGWCRRPETGTHPGRWRKVWSCPW